MSVINTKILIRGIVQVLVLYLVLGLVLFLAAGTVSWFYGWVFLILFYGFSFGIVLWLLRHDPGLIEERTGFKSNQPTWDKAYVILLVVFFGIWWISMPLDAVRFHWSQMPAWLHLVGAIVLLSSFYLFYLTFRENSYLSTVVRVQEDRGQTVVSTGPYRYVRHPMYIGMLLFCLGSALLLESWIGVLLGLLHEGMLATRALREERVLQKGLKGYDAYMAQVRYRLIPHVW
ncbi:MAG: isoprenylcysteine carboxylmethyltransferase family protein [Halobacteriota archaeon]